ncbi:DUF2304 domain-containing protein [Pyxidicoccus fallax]|uniref:DUF2304 domain-containing protein n=1 Tax=Pyxidicoccus fallax TaxID=394095 RepID=A0A848LR57_9BACT|nr:DUF2304 domain-containing protein [Pyxidicoccus fallax]NMO20387.1 DUF2304 domain-containing protein [Pyxidicoccus fallax]NPC81127.1 DUF2304 domain-containing protein [Pyxidicoccus fallax]
MFRSSLIGVAFATAFALTVLLSARRRRTSERHTFAWLMVAAIVAGLSLWRDGVDTLARAMGIYYPPSALFFLACTTLLWLVYRLSLQVADQRQQIKRLAQEVAILAAAEQERRHPSVPAAVPVATQLLGDSRSA